MTPDNVRKSLKEFKVTDRIHKSRYPVSAVEDAADSLGIIPSKLVRTTAFINKAGNGCNVIVTSIDTNFDFRKYKSKFRYLPEDIEDEKVLEYTGHEKEFMCPFAVDEEHSKVYIDKYVKRFDYVYVPAGDDYTVVKLSPEELFKCAKAVDWVDVAKSW